MTCFFFDIYRDGEEPEIDDRGIDLPDLAGIRSTIVAILPRLATPALICGDVHDLVCIIRDESGSVRYKALISVRGEIVQEQCIETS